jgi:hypothetical protein
MFQTLTSSLNTRIGFVQWPIVEIVLDHLVLDEEEEEFIMKITLRKNIISIIYSCVPIAMYLEKMPNVLQTCLGIFLQVFKIKKKLKHACPTNLDFFGAHIQKPK